MKRPALVLVTTDQQTNPQLAKLGVDFLEVRVDLLKNKSLSAAQRLFHQRRKLKIPLILTVRNAKKEGAVKSMSEVKKWELLQTLLPLTDWVDIELSSPLCGRTVALARRNRKKTMISAHDFERTPSIAQLNQILKKGLSAGGQLVKIAAMTKTDRDLLRLMEFTHAHAKQPLATMGMGPIYGALSRLILPAVGSRLVYTFLNQATASGQMDVHSYKELASAFKYS